MTRNSDRRFDLFIAGPYTSLPHKDKIKGSPAETLSLQRAPFVAGLRRDELSGALRVVKKARGAARFAKRLASKAPRAGLRAHPLMLTTLAVKGAARGLGAATGPLRRKVFKAFFRRLINRRARLLSWQRRRSLRATHDEMTEARRWAVAYVKRRGILGKLIGTALSGDVIGEPATASLVTASIPVILALARRALRSAEGHGAPADPRIDPAAGEGSSSNAEDEDGGPSERP